MKAIKEYLNSFKLKKTFWQTFAIDLITILLILALFASILLLLNSQAKQISNGKDIELLKQQLLDGTIDSQQFLGQIKMLIFILLVGGSLVTIASLLLYSFSRNIVWNLLLNQKSKLNWKWNWLIIILIIFATVYTGIGLFIWMLLNLLIAALLTAGGLAASIITGIMLMLLLIIWLFFAMAVYYSYSHSNKIWLSIGEAFNVIKTHWSKLWKALLLAFFTLFIINLIAWLLGIWLFSYPTSITIIKYGMFFFFVTWLRVYLVSLIKEN